MSALARDGKVGAFEMEARDAPDAACNRRLRGSNGGAGFFGGVGDESRQDPGRSQRAVGGGDAGEGGNGRVVIEQDAVAAVDLKVHVAGRDDVASKVDALGSVRVARRSIAGEDPVLEPCVTVRVQCGAVKHRTAGNDKAVGAHTVSVTLLRWRGASGSMPRARATASTMP